MLPPICLYFSLRDIALYTGSSHFVLQGAMALGAG
jgi:hypothetical protein